MGSQAKRDIDAVVVERDKTVFWTTVAVTDITKSLKLWEENIYVSTVAAAGTLTLPNVSEAKDLTFNICSLGATNVLTIKDRGDSFGWTNITVVNAGDNRSVTSNGKQWVLNES